MRLTPPSLLTAGDDDNHHDDVDTLITRFMGSLTALLVLASMMPVFTGDLPKASYTKVMDTI